MHFALIADTLREKNVFKRNMRKENVKVLQIEGWNVV